ncbi:LolA family protein [Natronorubrum sp. DTA28]|uniref:LolA family protein n=1 Tax=Natronorubrum sp. DTA28 TaxID=3447019 RepID=UPI003F84CCA8
MASRRFNAVLGALVILVLIGGCIAFSPSANDDPEPDDPDPEALFESTYVYGDTLEDVSGEMTIEITGGNETVSETVRVHERPYVDYYEEVLETTEADQDGAIFASNASGAWWYYPESSLAQHHEADEPFESDAVRSDRAEMAQMHLEWYDLEYLGVETIADRETHVLDVDLNEEAVADGISVLIGSTEYVYALETVEAPDELNVVEQTVWVDDEYDYPVKERMVFEIGGERYEMTEEFDTVSFNEGLADETFEFEPPENATIESR